MDIHSTAAVKNALNRVGVRPSKGMGQSFLVNGEAAERMVAALNPFSPSTVLEIGPGLGALTRLLVERGYDVVCIEMDKRLARFVETSCGVNVTVGDAVRVPWPECEAVISNLPYSASTPITMRALGSGLPAVFTYQKELADRILAPPKTPDYSRLTVSVRTRCEVERLFDMGPSLFYPRPAVTSTCLRMTPSPMFPDEVYPHLDRSLRLFFNQRRKTIGSVVKGRIRSGALPPEAREVPFAHMRPEELSLDEHGELATWLSRFWG